MTFKITSKDPKSKARTGLLSLRSGPVKTPFFMPVATKTAVKHISSEDLRSMNAKVIISNAFVLSFRPGDKVVKKMGGISKFMSFGGGTFTDSGGFQMYSKSIYISSEETGVQFRNPFSGEKIFMTPKDNMNIHLNLGSDVAMCLDSMPLYGESKESISEAIRKTTNWAKLCKLHHDKSQKGIPKEKRQLLFGITQGGTFDDLRALSTKEISKIDFDGFALGGLALGEPQEDEYRMIEVAKKILPENKPVYLMGAGDPIELLEAISRGVDIFDSRFPTKNARHGTIFTWNGRIHMRSAVHKHSFEPIDKECDCFVCKTYTRSYLRHVLTQEEGVGFRLCSYHNLYFLQRLMDKARENIEKGTFSKFLKEMNKRYEKSIKIKRAMESRLSK